jgi:hypothetical protein
MKEEETKGEEHLYRSCCGGSTDRRLLLYLSQLSFSLITVGFCIVKLSTNGETSIYLPLLTSTCALWLPNPKFEKTIK